MRHARLIAMAAPGAGAGILAAVFLIAALGRPSAAGPQGSVLDLDQYELTFNEDFDTLDVSAWGPGSRWIAHTPWGGDFGDARFVDPRPGFPFTVQDGVLRIEARKNPEGKWESGLLASVDKRGEGFSQQYGYFEMRAKLPPGPGLWPAFWLDSMIAKEVDAASVEIDVLEHYGKFPEAYNSVVIVWPKNDPANKRSESTIHKVPSGSLYADFHTYGVSVDPEWTVIYLDRVEKWRVKTPPEHKHNLMLLVNLAMGSGWPITETPNPSYMYVDYIRAYRRR